MDLQDRVVIKTENDHHVVYVDGKQVWSESHYEDFAYTNAQAVRRKEIHKLLMDGETP